MNPSRLALERSVQSLLGPLRDIEHLSTATLQSVLHDFGRPIPPPAYAPTETEALQLAARLLGLPEQDPLR